MAAGKASIAANGSLSLYLILLIVVLKIDASYSQEFGLAKNAELLDVCSRNMPCGWALCEWTNYHNSGEEICSVIKNTGCRCYNGHLCSINLDSLEPSSYDRPYIKYEYLCRKQTRLMNILMSK